MQFETDIGASSNLRDVTTGAGCPLPPIGANFYPFYSLGRGFALGSSSVWNFGTVIPRVTTRAFGEDAQYGTPDAAVTRRR